MNICIYIYVVKNVYCRSIDWIFTSSYWKVFPKTKMRSYERMIHTRSKNYFPMIFSGRFHEKNHEKLECVTDLRFNNSFVPLVFKLSLAAVAARHSSYLIRFEFDFIWNVKVSLNMFLEDLFSVSTKVFVLSASTPSQLRPLFVSAFCLISA